ncbi:FecR domain-containing protein [Zestomonas carbonaria]|uniref:Protein FecR n=1 Tax=Zestomonas carbonaria TaxID=2762745 RepID=A0A7U7EIT6_9GAMM|nr:FecR domain-containing protein [Pseudomonas carbonaria]CAD5105828.1 Protein FecR [Pseudomonas carbonaria]
MSDTLDRQVLEAAATWYVQLNAAPPSDAERQAWRAWLELHPAHAQAWARVEKLQRQLGSVPRDVALPTLAGVRARRRAVLKTLAVLLAAGGLGLGAREPLRGWMADYRTARGERRRLTLVDGSRLDLNTASAVDVVFDAGLRQILLRHGEILVETAADPAGRPFVVHLPEGSVRALGTRFSVRSEDGRARVAVFEHAVEIRPAHWAGAPLRLEAGAWAAFDAQGAGRPVPLAVGEGAWRQGMLSVVDWRLGDLVAELARYRPGHIRCADSVADLRLSGAFSLDDTDLALENLAASLPVRVRYLTRYWVSVEPA